MFEIHARAESHGATEFQFQNEQLALERSVLSVQTHENSVPKWIWHEDDCWRGGGFYVDIYTYIHLCTII